MPFTVITDELVGAKPDSEYCFVDVQLPQGSETWIVGSERLEALMKELRIENYSVTKRVKGRELEGIQIRTSANRINTQHKVSSMKKTSSVHSIVAEEFVDVYHGLWAGAHVASKRRRRF